METVPMLAVSNMEASIRFYVDGLGFSIAQKWVDDGTIRWCRVERDGAAVMLQDFRRDGGAHWHPDGKLGLGLHLFFICADAIAIYRQARERGLTVSTPVVGNRMWVTEMHDPDGYEVAFESPTESPEDTVYQGS